MTVRCFRLLPWEDAHLPHVPSGIGSGAKLHGNTNEFELREDLKLDQLIGLSLRTNEPSHLKRRNTNENNHNALHRWGIR
jgi:hypothetical protein